MIELIGRQQEQRELEDLYNRNKAEFVVIYGRRRVGKTYLVDETFGGRITFRHAGLSPIEFTDKSDVLKEQLTHFYNSLIRHGVKKSKCPTSWLEAFFMLEMHLQSIDNGTKQIVFLDELPWMDTPRSGFITALEGFWNTWACHRHNFMLVVCGSATSWILDNLINNHGGLYGRVTHEIKLSPFSLKECEEFFKNRNVKMSRYDIVQSYMMLGGIPFYLDYFRKGMSLAQNIDKLFFSRNAILLDEYDRLFSAIFSNPEEMKRIVSVLSTRRCGYSRQDIIKKTNISDNGSASKMLKALEASDFVLRYVPFGADNRTAYYKLTDQFCLFYLKWVADSDKMNPDFWMRSQSSQSVASWRGFAFEEVCLAHIQQIKAALGIAGVSTTQSAWALRGDNNVEGTQIDLLINRKDNIVNMCEMKFYGDNFAVNGAYERTLAHREIALSKMLNRRTVIHPVLITTYGLEYGEYSGSFVHTVVMDDLFK
ncbi:MAG: ATP-binding protein [Bacteroidales bacterium]|nr:ATP-binding protein [Bacteroidales bacterium]